MDPRFDALQNEALNDLREYEARIRRQRNLRAEKIAACRDVGCTWQQIADLMGISVPGAIKAAKR